MRELDVQPRAFFPLTPVVARADPFLEDVRFRACLNWVTPRSTLRNLVHMKRPLRFRLGHGLSNTACSGEDKIDEDMILVQIFKKFCF